MRLNLKIISFLFIAGVANAWHQVIFLRWNVFALKAEQRQQTTRSIRRNYRFGVGFAKNALFLRKLDQY
jgi:hypothetical protein